MVTETVARTTTQAAAQAAPIAGGRHFQGDGNVGLGTITVHRPSVIQWTAQRGGTFVIYSSDNDRHVLDLRSEAAGGRSVIEAGTYHDVQVQAYGRWSFSIS